MDEYQEMRNFYKHVCETKLNELQKNAEENNIIKNNISIQEFIFRRLDIKNLDDLDSVKMFECAVSLQADILSAYRQGT